MRKNKKKIVKILFMLLCLLLVIRIVYVKMNYDWNEKINCKVNEEFEISGHKIKVTNVKICTLGDLISDEDVYKNSIYESDTKIACVEINYSVSDYIKDLSSVFYEYELSLQSGSYISQSDALLNKVVNRNNDDKFIFTFPDVNNYMDDNKYTLFFLDVLKIVQVDGKYEK